MSGSSTDVVRNQLATRAAARQQGVAVRSGPQSVLEWLNSPSTLVELTRALPRSMSAERFARIVQTETRRNPALLESDPASFVLAVLNFAALGLEPGPLGHAYLTGPFKNNKTGRKETVGIIGYKGLAYLALEDGHIDGLDAILVHEGEPFRIDGGSTYRLQHEIRLECQSRPVVGAYAIAFPHNSSRAVFEVMTIEQIDAVRARSRAKDDGPWKTDEEAMQRKTVLRRLLNRGKVRLSVRTAQAVAEDEARDLGYERPEVIDVLPGQDEPQAAAPEQAEAAQTVPATAREGGELFGGDKDA
jgi:recombination protein RecT